MLFHMLLDVVHPLSFLELENLAGHKVGPQSNK
jgi:hypothetical protein